MCLGRSCKPDHVILNLLNLTLRIRIINLAWACTGYMYYFSFIFLFSLSKTFIVGTRKKPLFV